MERMSLWIHETLTSWGIGPEHIEAWSAVTMFVISVLGSVVVYKLLSRGLEPLIDRITRSTSFTWDDIVLRHKMVRWVWILVSALIVYGMLPKSLGLYPSWLDGGERVMEIVILLTMMMIVIEVIKSVFLLLADRDNLDDIARQMRQASDNGETFSYTPSHSLKGLEQMLTIIVVAISIVLCVSIIFGKNPLIIFSGLSAGAAVLMLVFQDSILGVVAGVQLTANDMLQPGDWIVVSKYGANGIVREVTLATVKVQNWDKTIVTIPPYNLIKEGFQNWRGMQESDGRRITRSINIDMNSVRHATAEELESWRGEPWWRPEFDGKEMVNMSAFRHYLEHYVATLPELATSLIYMVRELAPTTEGLPVEMYFFTKNQEWKRYEEDQANVVDHVLATVQRFGLRIYQSNRISVDQQGA